MLRCDEVDIVNTAHILQFDEPLGELLWREIKAIARVRDVVILGTGSACIHHERAMVCRLT